MKKSPRINIPIPMGQIALHKELALKMPEPPTLSYIVSGSRRTVEHSRGTEEFYPPHYMPEQNIEGSIKFALKHEPLDLRVMVAALKALGEDALIDWFRREPTGFASRRAWFLYEHFTGNTLDIESVKSGNYTSALTEKYH